MAQYTGASTRADRAATPSGPSPEEVSGIAGIPCAWLPIESAPKDRTVIIGRDLYGNVFDCMFVSGDYFASVEGGDPCDYHSGWYRKNDDGDEVCPYLWIAYPRLFARDQVSA